MDNAYLDVHFFAVPFRLIWDNFKRFMGEQKTLETLPTSSLPNSLIFPQDLSSLTHLSTTWDYQLILPAFSNSYSPRQTCNPRKNKSMDKKAKAPITLTKHATKTCIPNIVTGKQIGRASCRERV